MQVFQRSEKDRDFIEFSELMDRYDVVKDYHIISHNPYESMDDVQDGYRFLSRLSGRNANVDAMRLQILKGSILSRSMQQLPSNGRSMADGRAIVYKQMASLFGSQDDFKAVSEMVDHNPDLNGHSLQKHFPNIFKPYKTGFTNVYSN